MKCSIEGGLGQITFVSNDSYASDLLLFIVDRAPPKVEQSV